MKAKCSVFAMCFVCACANEVVVQLPPVLCETTPRVAIEETCPPLVVPRGVPYTTDTEVCVSQSSRVCVCHTGGAGYELCLERYWAGCICAGPERLVDNTPGMRTHGAPIVLPPRLVAPLSGMRVTSRRPTLRWVLPAGIEQASVDLCHDRECTRPILSERVTGDHWRADACLQPGVVFWRVRGFGADGATRWTSATWEFSVRWRDTPVDSVMGPMRDINGDGYDDAFTGWQFLGKGLIIFGHNGAPRQEPLVSNVSQGSHSTFADFNGDGYADVLAIQYGPFGHYTLMGQARCGLRLGTQIVPSMFTGVSAADAGDFDGDGYGDVVSLYAGGAALFTGGPSGVSLSPFTTIEIRTGPTLSPVHTSGSNIAFLGDVDGDGYGDFATGDASTDTPAIRVLYGNPERRLNARVQVLVEPDAAEGVNPFSEGLAAGDFNGDGFGDLSSVAASGRLIFQGSRSGLSNAYMLSNIRHPGVGGAPGKSGDLNGDGFADLAQSVDGGIYLSTGLQGLRMAGVIRLDSSSRAIELVGDLNGDGFDDVFFARAYGVELVQEHFETCALSFATLPEQLMGCWQF
jgi:hypothetical protein